MKKINFKIKHLSPLFPILSGFRSSTVFFLFLGIIGMASCNKDITETTDLWSELAPTKLDDGAGIWKTILLANADEVKIPTPDAISTPQYQAELAEVKTLSANLTTAQKK